MTLPTFRKALHSAGAGSSRQPQRAQQPHRSASTAATLAGGSSSRRDSLEEALEAIAIAESQQMAKQEELQRQQRRAASLAPAGPASLSNSPSGSGDAAMLWQAAAEGGTGDPWSSSPGWHQQQQDEAQLSASPARSFASMLQEQQLQDWQHNLHQQQQQQDEEEDEPWPALDSGCCSPGAGWQEAPHHLSSAEAYSWRSFAMSFAEAAAAAGNEEAADGALQFSASEPLAAAVFAAADDSAVAELGEVAEQAAAAGLTVQELLQAQQEELLLQINKAKRKGPVWRQVQLQWANAASASDRVEAGPCASSSRGHSPPARLQLPDVDDQAAFPQLQPSPPNAAGWQQVQGRSPHSLPRGWKGGRQAPKAKGIKLLHTPSSSSDRPEQHRVSRADLHWDLRLEGLAPMQREGADSLQDIDPWGVVVGNPAEVSEAQAAQRTRQLVTDQQEAAAAAAAAGAAGSSSSRDRCAPDTVRAMMQKAAAKGSRAGAAGSSQALEPAAAAEPAEVEERGMGGSKATFSYSWSSVFKLAMAAGWVPVPKAEGGGGSHFKLRRTLPVSGVVQTMVIPCTPSDSQRGVRNVAAGFKKRDEEKLAIEAQAAAAKQQAEGKAGKARGKRKT